MAKKIFPLFSSLVPLKSNVCNHDQIIRTIDPIRDQLSMRAVVFFFVSEMFHMKRMFNLSYLRLIPLWPMVC